MFRGGDSLISLDLRVHPAPIARKQYYGQTPIAASTHFPFFFVMPFGSTALTSSSDKLLVSDKRHELFFMRTEFLMTIFARKASIGVCGKAFGMATKGDLPTQKQQEGHTQKRPCIKIGDKHIRGKHHGIIPIIDTAIGTASVFHKPCLKRTEKQYSDHIANTVSKADQNQDPRVYGLRHIEDTDRGIEHKPHGGNRQSALPRLQPWFIFPCRLIVSCKLLLAPGTFYARREESQDHFDSVDQPYHRREPDRIFITAEYSIGVFDAICYIQRQCRSK